MRQNPARRTALLDAAIEVLAREGSRGLTFRAVDSQAGVPIGTTSNHFPNRDELLAQVTQRTRERLSPTDADVSTTMQVPPTRALVIELMLDLARRMRQDRSSYLAMLELRLEATRRPELQAMLTKLFTANLEDGVRFHLDAGLPGDAITVVVLYLAMSGFLVDDITVPEVLAAYPTEQLIAAMVERIVPGG